ncbi:hypothetical protein [Sulfobacillus thermosulfidooxidans]|uniref:hypothetical protein n=1 Tax=Sulfobacillus thermosulfidooxidans TaxID=28034 RepID=UPI0002D83A55|nr:hypothetical protein [Sulfobacillus thermosulfidooxidans]
MAWLIQHFHPAIIHFPIVLFLLTAVARNFSNHVPQSFIRLGLLLSLIFGLLAIVSGLVAAQPQLTPPDRLLTWHMRLASLWIGCVLYLYLAHDHEPERVFTTLIWIAATLLIVAIGTLGGLMVYAFVR